MEPEHLPPEIDFRGPFSFWPKDAEPWELGRASECSGLYLFTVEVAGENRVLYVGEADHIGNRMREHIGCYLAGRYWLYDPRQLLEGSLVHIWKPTSETETALRKFDELQRAVRGMLPLISVFVCSTNPRKSGLRRIESALIQALQKDPDAAPFLENDRLSVRYRLPPQTVRVKIPAPIRGVPAELLA